MVNPEFGKPLWPFSGKPFAVPIEERAIHVNLLELGMYVSRLERPWSETPFALEGVRLETFADIAQIAKHGPQVFIDVEKSAAREPRTVLLRLGFGALGRELPPSLVAWNERHVAIDEELPRARRMLADVRPLTERLIDDLRAGRDVSSAQVDDVVEPVVISVLRNPDAFQWLEAARLRDPYAYTHALSVSGLAAVFGRHLCLPKEILVELAAGGLLMDIGFSVLEPELTTHPGPLSDVARQQIRTHVSVGLEALKRSGIDRAEVVEMIYNHHERHDGSGYPNGLQGLAISLNGRILGMVDTYDALLSDRPWRAGLSKHHALETLYRERNRLFQAELVEQFSQALGVYPTGTVVQLSSGEIAVVRGQNLARRLYPQVTVIFDPDGELKRDFPQRDLWADRGADNRRLSIARALPRGPYQRALETLFL